MTVFDASQAIVKWFNKNDFFCVEDHYSSITGKSSLSDPDEAAINCSLKELEKNGFLCSSRSEKINKTFWVLKQPLVLFPQNVEISGVTALNISNIINNFFSLLDDDSEKSDALNITENDIDKIINICSYLAENMQQNLKNQEEKPQKPKDKQ